MGISAEKLTTTNMQLKAAVALKDAIQEYSNAVNAFSYSINDRMLMLLTGLSCPTPSFS